MPVKTNIRDKIERFKDQISKDSALIEELRKEIQALKQELENKWPKIHQVKNHYPADAEYYKKS